MLVTVSNQDVWDINVSDLPSSKSASRFPKNTEKYPHIAEDKNFNTRPNSLGSVGMGTGHDNFLKGINVSFTIRFPQAWLRQVQRYNFFDIVSSQSTMHSICKFDISEQLHSSVDKRVLPILQEKIDNYNENPTRKNAEKIIYNIPMGFMLSMRIRTNYMQLKTIYYQRKKHRLRFWEDFCKKFIRELPQFLELTGTS